MIERSRRGRSALQLMGLLVAAFGLAAGAVLAWHHPVAPLAVLIAFLFWTVAVASWPGLWLFVVPAALPLLNFAPWTGWVVFEEFDLLLLGVAAGAYARPALAARATRLEPGWLSHAPRGRVVFVGLAVLFGALGVVSLGRGAAAAGGASFGWFQGYADPLNGWRVFKSLLYAALVWPLLSREISIGVAPAVRRLASGMLVGLTVVTLAVAWERAAYPGWWNFAGRYRTTALFWEMHVGGAAIDAYLALATPFVAWALWSSRTPLRWAAAAALALLTGYACLTTFSRGVYAAVAGPLVLLGLLLASRRSGEVRETLLRALRNAVFVLCIAAALSLAFDTWGHAGAGLLLLGLGTVLVVLKRRTPTLPWRPLAAMALGVALALEAVSVLGLGSYMRERVAASDHDLSSRLVHWRNGLGLMQGSADWIWGLGLGRLPVTYARAVPGGSFPGSVQFVPAVQGNGEGRGRGPDAGSVRVSGPKTQSGQQGLLALTQRVALRPVLPYEVAFDVRAQTKADVYLRLCEMHLLYPRNCQSAFVRVPPGGAPWRRMVVPLRGPLLDAGSALAPRLGVFSIAVLNVGGVAEFRNLSLVAPDRTEALVNRDFSAGLARWFAAAQGYYVPWHIDNLYLELLIERGAPALLAFMGCMGLVLWRVVGAASRTQPIAPFLAASLFGALIVGGVSSVMDVPRVAFLLFLLTLAAMEVAWAEPPRER